MNRPQIAGKHSHALKIVKAHPTAPDIDEDLASEFTERAYIAALIRDPDGRKLIHEGIAADHFTRPECREAFTAITLLLADGIQPDAATMSGLVEGVTLIEVETAMIENVSAANRLAYVTVLKEYKLKRDERAIRQKLLSASNTASQPELQRLIDELKQHRQPLATPSRFQPVNSMTGLPAAEQWLIPQYITADSLNIMFGAPGCGKSFAAIDIACHVATGREWRGKPVQQGHVIYIAGEGKNGLSKRLKAWFESNNEDAEGMDISTTPIAITDPDSVSALITDIQAMPQRPALIVIDTLNRNFGPGDENSTADMTAAVAGLDAIRAATGAALLVLHHSGHAEKGRGRGSSVLLGAADAEWSVVKNERLVEMRCTKAKDIDAPDPLAWTLTRYDLPWANEDGQPLNSAVLVPNDFIPAARPVKDKLSGQQRQAMTLLEQLLADARRNLKEAGHDPNQARVRLEDWEEGMKDISPHRSRRSGIRSALLNSGLVRVENGFVYIT